jgi:hypothetical protein
MLVVVIPSSQILQHGTYPLLQLYHSWTLAVSAELSLALGSAASIPKRK